MVRQVFLAMLVIGSVGLPSLGQDFFPPPLENLASVFQPLPPADPARPFPWPYSAPIYFPGEPFHLPGNGLPAESPPEDSSLEVLPDQPIDASSEADIPALDPVLIEGPIGWRRYDRWKWLSFWKGSLELGVSGSEGNSETFNYQLGMDTKRKTKQTIVDFDLKYHRKTTNSIETAHRLFAETRWEWLFTDSPWTCYVRQLTEYDEFTAYDLRVGVDTGLGYKLIDSEPTSLLARVGAGTSREIGNPNAGWVPEAVFGMEFSHQLSKRQKLTGSTNYKPDVTEFRDYRLTTKAGWEVLLDEEMNLSLKVSVLDRYDSTPNGKKPNDLDYTITLLWKF